jgi:hypothetical protein
MQRFDPREPTCLPETPTSEFVGRSHAGPVRDRASEALESLRQGERSAAAAYRHVASFDSFAGLRETLLTLAEGHEQRSCALVEMLGVGDVGAPVADEAPDADPKASPWEALRRPLARSTTADGRRATLAVLGEGERFRYLHALRAERVVPARLAERLAREVVAGQREALATVERLSRSST